MNVGHPRLGLPRRSLRRPMPIRFGIKMLSSIKSTSNRFLMATMMASAILPGLISRLDYIAELGVNTIWLLPFYPSPRLG